MVNQLVGVWLVYFYPAGGCMLKQLVGVRLVSWWVYG